MTCTTWKRTDSFLHFIVFRHVYPSLTVTRQHLLPLTRVTRGKVTSLQRLRLLPRVLGDLDTSSPKQKQMLWSCDLHCIRLYSTTQTQKSTVTMATPCLNRNHFIYWLMSFILVPSTQIRFGLRKLTLLLSSSAGWRWCSEAVQCSRLQKSKAWLFHSTLTNKNLLTWESLSYNNLSHLNNRVSYSNADSFRIKTAKICSPVIYILSTNQQKIGRGLTSI